MLYLDNAASGKITDEIIEYHSRRLREDFANQEALHREAYRLRRQLEDAGAELAGLLHLPEFETVLWFNSVTEIFALLGNFFAGKTALVNPLEHPAVLENIRRSCQCSMLPTSPDGAVIPDGRQAELLFIHHVQSELGRIQDISAITAATPDAVTIVDAAQSAGKLPLPDKVQLIALSGAKMGAPGGAALLINRHWQQAEQLTGFYRAARTERHSLPRVNVPQIETLVFAAGILCRDQQRDLAHVTALKKLLIEQCAGSGTVPTLPEQTPASPYIVNLSLPGQQGAVVVRTLSEQGIYVASGSACAAEAGGPSPALLAIGLNRQRAYNALRISFNAGNTPEEVLFFASALKNVLKNY